MTMAAARLVMVEWGDSYRASLEIAKLEIGVLTGYVDDVRQKSNCFRMGTRFSVETGTFTITQEAKNEDKQLKKVQRRQTTKG